MDDVLVLPADDSDRDRLAALHEAAAEYHRNVAAIYRDEPQAVQPLAPSEDALPTDATVYERPDYEAILRRLMNETRSSNARQMVRRIAELNLAGGHAWGHEIRTDAGMGHQGELGGTMRSLSSAARRLGIVRPYSRDWDRRGQVDYTMKPHIAKALVKILDQQGDVH